MQTVILAGILGLVFIALPVFLGKKSGVSPMELLFGSRINNTPFRKDAGEDTAENEEKKRETKGKRIQTNGSKQDLLQLISSLVSFGRKNHFYTIAPGTVQWEGQTASLAVIFITRSAVIGINCFGYGGVIDCERGDMDWTQSINGEKRKLESPVKKNENQKAILKGALTECGYGGLPVYVYGVFTTKDVRLKGRSGDGFYTRDELLQALSATKLLRDDGVDMQKVGSALAEKAAKPDKGPDKGRG